MHYTYISTSTQVVGSLVPLGLICLVVTLGNLLVISAVRIKDGDSDDNGDLNHALLAGEDLQQALRPHLHHHRLPRRGGPPARPPRPAALCCVRGQSIQILSMGKFEHFIYQYQTKELFNKHHIMIN